MNCFFSLRLGWIFLAGAATYTANEAAADITKEFDQTYTAGADHTVVVDAIAAEVNITAIEGDQILLHMVWTADTNDAEKAERIFDRLEFEVEEDGDETEFSIDRKKDGWFSRSSGKTPKVRIDLQVPSELDLVVDLTSGRIVARGVNGDHVFDTTSASIMVEDCQGDVRADSTSGAVEIVGCLGDHRIDTTSGSILVSGGQGDVRADTVSGSVRIEEFPGSHIVDTVSGSVRVTLASVLSHDCRFDTVSGSIKVLVPEDIAARFEIETVSGGIDLSLPGVEILHREKRELVAEAGHAGRTVRLDTVSGSVRVEPYSISL